MGVYWLMIWVWASLFKQLRFYGLSSSKAPLEYLVRAGLVWWLLLVLLGYVFFFVTHLLVYTYNRIALRARVSGWCLIFFAVELEE